MKNLVKQTLEHNFDLPQYTDFVKNLFNEIQIQPQQIKVPDSSKEFIKKITFLSDFSDRAVSNLKLLDGNLIVSYTSAFKIHAKLHGREMGSFFPDVITFAKDK